VEIEVDQSSNDCRVEGGDTVDRNSAEGVSLKVIVGSLSDAIVIPDILDDESIVILPFLVINEVEDARTTYSRIATV
jgi:hypothetical protein